MKDKKYILITKDLHKGLIDFLDEVQFDIAANTDKDSMHKVNFISWAIGELVNSFEAYIPQKKSREDYVDETFMDWNLPEMNDEEYNKLVDQVDGFLKGWEKEYNKKSKKKKSTKDPRFKDSRLPKEKQTPQSKEKFVPPLNDIAEFMSLDEIKEYLLDDEDLTTEEAFDLYYDEHRRVQKDKDKKQFKKSLNKTLKDLGIDPTEKN